MMGILSKLSRRTDWGPEFWRFAVHYTFWPPFAWEITSHLGMARLAFPRRVALLLSEYLKIVVLAILSYVIANSAANGDWLLAAILVAPAIVSFLVTVSRIQATYLVLKENVQ